MEYLECHFCQKKYDLDLFNSFCSDCQEPLLYHYPQRKRAFNLGKLWSLEEFLDFLPLSEVHPEISLSEGRTPLLKLNNIGEKYGLPTVFAKNEALNPTSSFKDRGTAVAIQKAVSKGIARIGTVSTGNMASSTAAYGAKAGLKTVVLVKEDTPIEKLLSISLHNPVLISVKGDYGELFYQSSRIGRKQNIYFMNSVDPFRIEGYKVTGFEIFLQLDSKVPDYIFIPVSSGGHLIGLMRAFLDLRQTGMIQKLPVFIGIQARGCAPIAKAYRRGKSRVDRIRKAVTIAHAISNPDPPGGNIALNLIQTHGGMILDVSDEEILNAQRILAEKEGIFCLPASATTLAGLLKLSGMRSLKFTDQVVLIITGSGLKDMEALRASTMNIHHASLSDLEEKMRSLV